MMGIFVFMGVINQNKDPWLDMIVRSMISRGSDAMTV